MVGASPQVRVTIHMAAAFQTYFMYADFNPRKPPGSMTHPMSRWIALAGKRWQFYAVATGLSGPGNKWFTLCQRKSTAAVDRKPLDPAQIPPANTPVTTVSRSVSGSFVLPVSPTAKTGLEAGC